MFVMVLLGYYIVIDAREGTVVYNVNRSMENGSFEDSDMFNSMMGNCASDIICYGAIRAQMETEGEFDAGKRLM